MPSPSSGRTRRWHDVGRILDTDQLALVRKSIEGVIAQGGPSVHATPNWNNFDGSLCLYRGQNDFKCAAGHLIPDDKYSPDMEGHDFIYVNGHWGLGFRVMDAGMICMLQRSHDDAAIDFNAKRFVKGNDFWFYWKLNLQRRFGDTLPQEVYDLIPKVELS